MARCVGLGAQSSSLSDMGFVWLLGFDFATSASDVGNSLKASAAAAPSTLAAMLGRPGGNLTDGLASGPMHSCPVQLQIAGLRSRFRFRIEGLTVLIVSLLPFASSEDLGGFQAYCKSCLKKQSSHPKATSTRAAAPPATASPTATTITTQHWHAWLGFPSCSTRTSTN